ncbi:MAG TPA: hypothetical protein VGS23_07450, partial [Thermoplasmata archaeon]|nr:hypothetical protein [Thermoplasmata archaeon]
ARVAELETASRSRSPSTLASDPRHWPGPSLCVGCGTALVGGPDDARCPRCGRPLCSKCSAAVPDGPGAHECPECRGVPTVVPAVAGPPPTRRLTWWESP